MATTKPTTPKTAKMSDKLLKDINDIRISKYGFQLTLTVDVDFADKTVSVTYVNPISGITSKVFNDITSLTDFATRLHKIVFNAHEAAKRDLKANAAGLILKVIALDASRDGLKTALSDSNHNVKVANQLLTDAAALDQKVMDIKASIEKSIEASKANIASLTAELDAHTSK